MKKQEKRIIEIRSKEKTSVSRLSRWVMKKGNTGDVWQHHCVYADEWTTVHFVRETKRGFTFSVYFAGKYTNHFVSRGDCEIIFEL